ncbi:MAG: ice-binding family protein [Gemmatimonadaceae bacterium]
MLGSVHVGDPIAQQMYFLFGTMYGALAPHGGGCTILTGTLAERTLSPGTYCFDSSAALTGVLTLKGSPNAQWVFKIGKSGVGTLSATNLSVVMAGGGNPCHVIWWVREGATITNSDFQGRILAASGITLSGGTFRGHAYAQGAISISGTSGTAIGGCNNATVGT